MMILRSDTTRERNHVCCFLALLLLFSALASSASAARDSFQNNRLAPTVEKFSVGTTLEPAGARVSYVRDNLDERLHAVLSGARARQFEIWASKNDLDIVSMHGVDESISSSKFTTIDDSQSKRRKREVYSPFPSNILDLSMVENSNSPDRQHLGISMADLDDRSPSKLDLILRSIRLGVSFGPIVCTSWLAMWSSKFREKIWYTWIASCLASSGPAFIKWGQWASTRYDIFPESLCLALSRLHNDAPAHSWIYTQKVLESSLGLAQGTLLDTFDSFDEIPIASGSIAQVHRAVLKGTTIVAKVRHPKVAKLMQMDFRLMNFAARLADLIPALASLRIRDTVEQFSHNMAEQAHLQAEAHHLEILNYNFRKWKGVRFPRPFYATSNVIIETFASGRIVTAVLDAYDAIASQIAVEQGILTVEEISDDTEDEAMNTQKSTGHQVLPMSMARFIVTTGLSVYLKMLLIDKQMHADLHPGNIMIDFVSKNPKGVLEPNNRALVPVNRKINLAGHFCFTLVDAGMVAQLSQEESQNFAGLICSLGDGDGRVAGSFVLRFTKDSTLSSSEEEDFIKDMDLLFKERCRGYGSNVDVGHVLRGVLGLVRKHKVLIDANYATLVVNVLCVEGMSQRVCPNYNLLDAAKPFLESYKGLCYKKDGSINESSSKVQKCIFRITMPLAYFKKSLSDAVFFARQGKNNKRLI
mmetsp:Transcript_30095/g.45873  ORF Transcript_30095/g.45873 Transcript_30095/m.45873 type:complete len:699 (-) Transcript_30095:185-2281(-)